MCKNSNDKKLKQLGMPIDTASNRLKKSIIFSLIKRLGENFCFQCGFEIEEECQLSIEHKIPYLNSENPVELFFDIDNIAFSHLDCNIRAGRKRPQSHGNRSTYSKGCRCEDCTSAHKLFRREQRKRYKIASIAQLAE